MHKELWYFLISGQADDRTGLFGNFYVYGIHLGDASTKAFQAFENENYYNPNLVEASKLDNFEEIDRHSELVKLSEVVYMRQTTHSFPFADTDKEFIPPIGIVKSVDDGEYEYALIKENFVAYGQNENGIFEFELVVAKPDLINVFLKAISFLPTVDGFWVYIKNFWDNDKTELWVAKHFTDKKIVIEFLKTQQNNTSENGYLDLVVHSLEGETNLILDQHKTIKLHTKEEKVFKEFIGQIIELGYEQTREFYSLEYVFHHWHYRPANSLTRTDFKKMLVQNNFEMIDSWEE
ncbi:MAG: hypothetical protein ACSLE0_15470 [Chitinophagaceae bacterium]